MHTLQSRMCMLVRPMSLASGCLGMIRMPRFLEGTLMLVHCAVTCIAQSCCLDAGSVIKAWDVGVKSMRLGEKALLTCRYRMEPPCA